jgi:hypothetical protein
MADVAQGAGEQVSERTSRCVSEPAQSATPSGAAIHAAVVAAITE